MHCGVSMKTFIVCLLFPGVAAATGALPASDENTAPMDHGCIAFQSSYQWQPLDEHHLVLWTSHDDQAYLVTMLIPLTQLRNSERVEFVDVDGDHRLCGADTDKVIVSSSRISEQAPVRTG